MRRHIFVAALVGVAGLASVAARVDATPPMPPNATVYFDNDSAELSSAAKLTIINGLQQVFAAPCQNIRLSGHIDRAEAKRGNIVYLDRRRAENVRDAIRALKIRDFVIDIFTYGSECPQEGGGPDDNAGNRRVFIEGGC